ncbi:microtubule associated protein [Hysterangium stoloniferum]|nr:microtubule associated protein [Hysterangium stoloniferum]
MDGPPPQEEDFSQVPIADRLKHKNWKARLSAYEQLIKTFQTTASEVDPAFKPYLASPELLKGMVTDANVVAQEKGVDCVATFVKFAGESAARTRESVIPAVVDKCLGSTRAGTRNSAVELILQYVEMENGGAGISADLLPGLGAKQPKAVAGTVVALKELMRQFGAQTVPPPPILKALPKIFAHTDKTVRAEGTLLAQALYQCIGAAIEPFLSDLKPVQVKELHEAFEAMDKEGKGKGTFKAERLTRRQAREAEEAAAAAAAAGEDASGGGAAEEPAAPDPRMFADEVDVVSKLPSGYHGALSSSKWKERKDTLDEILTAVSVLKIKDAPEFGELIKALAGRMGDANINCVMVAAGCIEALAKGLMTAFGRFREVVVPPMLARLKERKQNVVDSLGTALDAVFTATTLPDILADIQSPLADKNPQVKEGTLKFLHRCLQATLSPPTPPQVKPLAETLANLLGDSAAPVRDEAAMALGTLMKIVGERALNPITEPLEAARKAKVKEAFDQATVKCKVGSTAPKVIPPTAKEAAPPKKKVPAVVKKASGEEADAPSSPTLLEDATAEPAKPRAKPPARLLAKKPAAAAAAGGSSAPAATAAPPVKKPPPAASAATRSGKPAAAAPPGALDTFKYKHTPEDAEGLAAALIPLEIATGFVDANWKARLAALEEMNTWLEGVIGEIDSEVLVRFIAKKGWNEKNFQVSAKIYGVLSTLAERCPSFGRSSVALSVGHLSEKLGDMKLKKPAGDTLLVFAEKTSLSFVLNQAYDPLSKQKAPKVLADAITWVNQALTEFGIAGLSLRNLIEFLKAALKNSNAAVRTSATTALVTLRLFAGGSIKELLEDLNPQLLTTIHSEFDKVDGQPAPAPTRTSTDVATSLQGGGSDKAGRTVDPLDDLFPRVDVDKLLAGTTILADAKSDAWKAKKDALEALQSLLDVGANKRLKPNMGEIGQVLKARVTDTNKAVQLVALDVVARIAAGMNKPFEKHARLFVVPVATALADQKPHIRAAAILTLTSIATACEGVEPMVAGIGTALETVNPLQRSSLLGWVVEWFKVHKLAPGLDLQPWAAPIVSCLEDRNGDVRKGAQATLPLLITSIGFDRVMKETGSLKPASRSTVVPFIQAGRTAAAATIPSAASAPSKSPPPPVVTTAVDPKSASPEVPSPPASATAPAFGNGRSTGVRSRKIQPAGSRPDSELSVRDDDAPASRLARPGGIGLKRPATTISAKTSAASSPALVQSSGPFVTSSSDPKKARLSKDSTRWIIESNGPRKDLLDILQHQMEPHASRELVTLLFSHDHNAINDHISGLAMIADCYSATLAGEDKYDLPVRDMTAILVANSDLPFKYISLKVHEPQPNLITKCLDVVDHVLALLRSANYQLTDQEALCFVPTVIFKLGDAREAVRVRVSQIIQALPTVFAYSRIFQLLLDHGLKSKVAKTRQGTLDELENILKRAGVGACEPSKALPLIAAMIADKDAQVRKSALAVLSEAYVLLGEKVWKLVGPLSPKDKTQLEERLRRVSVTPSQDANKAESVQPQVSRLATGIGRPASPASHPSRGPASIARPGSPSSQLPRAPPLARPASPASHLPRTLAAGHTGIARAASPPRTSPQSAIARPKSMLPSRLGPGRGRPNISAGSQLVAPVDRRALHPLNGAPVPQPAPSESEDIPTSSFEDISLIISSILSHDPTRSVDALKKIQRILEVTPQNAASSPSYIELSEHTEGLTETITLQMSHIFEHPEAIAEPDNFRLAKHLIQTLNAFCDHPLLAESLSVDIVTGLLEELTMRLLQTDDSLDSKVKDLSRFINMIILRLFATGRRIVIFRALFGLLLQVVKPFPANGTSPESREAKVAELVLKCVWKLARNIPSDLEKQLLDPAELFPAIEHFLQSVPPNEWRARATNKIPAGDMPLRTIKVIIQHVVAQYGDEVYEQLSAAFEDPSATIVYPYVYRILNSNNSNSRPVSEVPTRLRAVTNTAESARHATETVRYSVPLHRPISTDAISVASSSRFTVDSEPPRTPTTASPSRNGKLNLFSLPDDDDDPDAQLIRIIGNISSETTGALHKEGITQLHKFLKSYPHKKARVEKMLDSTGPAFRKYIARALASRAAEDDERDVAVADTLSRLEAVRKDSPISPRNTRSSSPRRASIVSEGEDPKLSRLHDLFGYHGRPTRSSAGSISLYK